MSAWPSVSLDDVFDIARGGSPRPIDDYITDDPGGINWVMIADAIEGSKYITGTRRRIRAEGAKRSRTVKPGDFLLTNSMSFGRPYIMQTSGCIHDGWLVLSPRRPEVDSDFFYHLLGSKSVYSEFERRAAGVTVKNLNIDLVKSVTIRLPPLSEQRRIATILDRADALRANRRAALAQLDTLTQAIFLDMFGDPVRNPKQWRVSNVGDQAEQVTDGEHLTPRRTTDGIKLLSARNIRDGYIDLRQVDYIGTEEYERIRRRCDPKRGDLLVSCSGTIGRVAPVDLDEPISLVRSAALIRPASSVLRVKFLEHYLRTPAMKARMLSRANASSQANLFQGQIRELPVLLPPVALQDNFTLVVDRVDRVRRNQAVGLADLDALFASLQHHAFRGDL